MSETAASRATMPRLVINKPAGAQQAEAPQRPGPPPPQSIGTFVALEIEARQCRDLECLRFAITNATRKLASYDSAVLAERQAGGAWKITCQSSVHKIDPHAPAIRFLSEWTAKSVAAAAASLGEPRFADLAHDARALGLSGEPPRQTHAFWLPIKGRDGEVIAALVALKPEPWRPQSTALLMPLAAAYGHAWEALCAKSPGNTRNALLKRLTKRRLAIAAGIGLLVAGFVPVPMSSLAPAEIIAREPLVVTAPIDGVIADIHQPPGTRVAEGAPLLSFVDVTLRNNLELARRNRSVVEARYFKAVQSATALRKDVEEVAIAKAELEVAAGELAHAQEVMSRTIVRAKRSGLVIYASKADWLGRPVKTGERILEIGDPEKTELRIDLPVSDALSLVPGGRVALFLDGDPMTAVPAMITRTSYRPAVNGDNQLIYRIYAAFSDGSARRIGLRGVARVSAGDVPLAFYLFRRPIAGLRQSFGL